MLGVPASKQLASSATSDGLAHLAVGDSLTHEKWCPNLPMLDDWASLPTDDGLPTLLPTTVATASDDGADVDPDHMPLRLDVCLPTMDSSLHQFHPQKQSIADQATTSNNDIASTVMLGGQGMGFGSASHDFPDVYPPVDSMSRYHHKPSHLHDPIYDSYDDHFTLNGVSGLGGGHCAVTPQAHHPSMQQPFGMEPLNSFAQHLPVESHSAMNTMARELSQHSMASYGNMAARGSGLEHSSALNDLPNLSMLRRLQQSQPVAPGLGSSMPVSQYGTRQRVLLDTDELPHHLPSMATSNMAHHQQLYREDGYRMASDSWHMSNMAPQSLAAELESADRAAQYAAAEAKRWAMIHETLLQRQGSVRHSHHSMPSGSISNHALPPQLSARGQGLSRVTNSWAHEQLSHQDTARNAALHASAFLSERNGSLPVKSAASVDCDEYESSAVYSQAKWSPSSVNTRSALDLAQQWAAGGALGTAGIGTERSSGDDASLLSVLTSFVLKQRGLDVNDSGPAGATARKLHDLVKLTLQAKLQKVPVQDLVTACKMVKPMAVAREPSWQSGGPRPSPLSSSVTIKQSSNGRVMVHNGWQERQQASSPTQAGESYGDNQLVAQTDAPDAVAKLQQQANMQPCDNKSNVFAAAQDVAALQRSLLNIPTHFCEHGWDASDEDLKLWSASQRAGISTGTDGFRTMQPTRFAAMAANTAANLADSPAALHETPRDPNGASGSFQGLHGADQLRMTSNDIEEDCLLLPNLDKREDCGAELVLNHGVENQLAAGAPHVAANIKADGCLADGFTRASSASTATQLQAPVQFRYYDELQSGSGEDHGGELWQRHGGSPVNGQSQAQGVVQSKVAADASEDQHGAKRRKLDSEPALLC